MSIFVGGQDLQAPHRHPEGLTQTHRSPLVIPCFLNSQGGSGWRQEPCSPAAGGRDLPDGRHLCRSCKCSVAAALLSLSGMATSGPLFQEDGACKN
jgi:hypothetical protein